MLLGSEPERNRGLADRPDPREPSSMGGKEPTVAEPERYRTGEPGTSAAATEAVRRRYERTAAGYEQIVSTAESTFFRGCRAWACAQASGDVLDLAAGTGRDLPQLTARTDVTSVTAIDLSPAMLDLARQRSDLAEVPVRYEVAGAADLPLESEGFDSVVAALAMDVLPDPAAVLSEVARVLRPDGQLVAFNYVPHPRAVARATQRVIEPLLWRFQGIRLTRDPHSLLPRAGLTMVESHRQAGGLVMRYRATPALT